jgi:hypothetical protein
MLIALWIGAGCEHNALRQDNPASADSPAAGRGGESGTRPAGLADAGAGTAADPAAARAAWPENAGRNAAPPARDIAPRALVSATDLGDLTIIVPEDESWKAVGNAIAKKIADKWKKTPRVEVSRALPTQGWSGNTLLIGNLGNNWHIAKLYAMRFTYADAVFPGKNGYQLQTLVDPFGLGGNTVVLAASEAAGLHKGAERLESILEQLKEPKLPWLSETAVEKAVASFFPYGAAPSEPDLNKQIKNNQTALAKLNPDRKQFGALLSLLGSVTKYGEYYQMTGNEAYGRLYRQLLLGYADFLNRYPDAAKDQLNDRENMWTAGMSLFAGWTVNEASPIFSEEDRRQIVSAIYVTLEANDRDGYINRLPDRSARFNHDIFPGLSIMYGASYFQKYYRDKTADAWYAKGERVFTGNTANITLDEGSDYLMHVPVITLDYALATGDRKFLTQGLRPSADLQALLIDNLGTMSGGGDVYPFGRSSAYYWGHSAILNAASWFFNEPLYQYLLERTRTGPFNRQGMDDLKYPFHRYMTDKVNTGEIPQGRYPLVQAYPVEQGVYDDLKKGDEAVELDVPQSETVHKLAFRQGLHPNDSYLMLDGFAAGRHNHHDANTIIRYSANGRIFIDDRDYIERGPEHHSGVIVVKDGVQEQKPYLSRLKWVGDADGIGVSRTELPNYNGTDWDRLIASPGGRFYLIYDEVRIREDGNYVLENAWQTLGAATVREDRFEVAQQGVTMTIQSLDESDLRKYSRYGHFIKYWKTVYPYPYADEENVLREVKEEKRYAAGDVSRFIHVLSSSQAGEPQVEAERLSERAVRIAEGDKEWLAYFGPVDAEPLSTDGDFALIGDGDMLIAGTRLTRIGTQTLEFDQPVLLRLNFKANEWKAFSPTKGMTRYDEQGNPLTEGLVRQGKFALSLADAARLKERLAERGPVPAKRPGAESAAANPPIATEAQIEEAGWSLHYRFPEEMTSAAAGDLDGDGVDELLIGGAKGKVQAIDSKGEALWTFDASGRVNEVTVQQLDGQPTVFVATENWYVYALDAQGREKWHYKFPDDSAHREQKGNLLGITNVRVAYVNGADQEPWIMVGTQFRYVYGLDRDGKLKYEDLAYFYGIEDMEFADFDGDGRDEGFLGMEYSYYVLWEDRKLTNGGGTSGPGWKVVETVADPDLGPNPAAVLGTKEHRVHLVQLRDGKLKELWQRNVGGEVNDIRIGDFNGDGAAEILVGSGGFQFYALNADGSVRARATLGDRVLKVAGLNRSGRSEYWAAADNGKLYRISESGDVVQSLRFSDSIRDIVSGSDRRQAWIVTAGGEVYARRN